MFRGNQLPQPLECLNWVLKFSKQRKFIMLPSEPWHRIVWYSNTNVSEEEFASKFGTHLPEQKDSINWTPPPPQQSATKLYVLLLFIMSCPDLGCCSDILITATDPTNFYVVFHTALSTEGNVSCRPQSIKGFKNHLIFGPPCSGQPLPNRTWSASDVTFVSTNIHQHV